MAAGSDRFWLLELRVSRTFLYQLRPQLSGHGYPTQRAANTCCPRSDRFWLLDSAFLGLFYTSRGPSFSGHGYPTQRAANTYCPRSDRFWRDFLRCGRQERTVSPVDVTAVRRSQLTYCVEVAAELLADVEEQTVRSVHQAQRPRRESPENATRVHGSERGTARSRRNRQRSGTSIRLGPS